MSIYKLAIDGCDDSTILSLAITDNQARFLAKVAEAVNTVAEENQPCAPQMRIEAGTRFDKHHFTIVEREGGMSGPEMGVVEEALWAIFDEERGLLGASEGAPIIARRIEAALLTDESVERAARAITPHLYYKHDSWEDADEEDRELAREIARDALKAMVGDDG